MKGEFWFRVPLTKEVNETMFSDRWALANSLDPNQTESSLIRVCTDCHSV